MIAERFSTNRKDKVQTVQIDKGLVQADGTISHHDMFDYLNLTNAGYKKVFEPIYDLLSQVRLKSALIGESLRHSCILIVFHCRF